MSQSIESRRRGAVLAATMVCLLVVMLFAAAVARSILLRQQMTRLDERQVQCFWLAESAVLRATSKCRADPNYRGEVWRVTAQVHGMSIQGIAEIQVEPLPGDDMRKQVKISARWPDAPVERVLRSKEFIVQSAPTGAAP
jgi:hypothetical protein